MTEMVADELFTSAGSAGPIGVNRAKAALREDAAKMIFASAGEERNGMTLDLRRDRFVDHPKSLQRWPNGHADGVETPKYQGVFRERITKVKQVTADIARRLARIKFTHENEIADAL
ncbi:hypothetical protein OAI12_01505 [Porticoccaceae bacterium]|nr:hypothetical protein [Porticoccaceae bacterium]